MTTTRHRRERHGGAALLTAMLTVMLVATFSAAAMWQQWRAAEIEAAERGRVQAAWVLVGALDWSRLILREDGRAGGPDHLAEPWAVPLEEARLSSFLSAEKNVASDNLEGLPDAFLSGRIVDAQSRLNVRSLVDGSKPVAVQLAAFTKLFALLGLPATELTQLTNALVRATPVATGSTPDGPVDSGNTANAPLMPERTSQLVWLGLSPTTVAALEPYVTVLPESTRLNLNTASAEAIYASVPALDMATARRLVEQRTRGHFATLAAANATARDGAGLFIESLHSVSTRFFEVHGKLRLDNTWVEERSLLQRDGIAVRTLWRDRGAGTTNALVKR
ncbi:MAG: general secretion pathway protein GspK [Variovorax sp.]|nr:MAG: general secretion pathway protein GspK [Variovorax sp.]